MIIYELEHIVEKQIDFLRKKGHKDIIAYAWTDMTYRGYDVQRIWRHDFGEPDQRTHEPRNCPV